jgi:serine/threonine protein phosphatase PrpC
MALLSNAVLKELKTPSVLDLPLHSDEDRHIIMQEHDKLIINDKLDVEFVAVFDGHGGKEASTFLKDKIEDVINVITFNMIKSEETYTTTLYKNIINNIIKAADKLLCDFLKEHIKSDRDPGSTFSMVINFIEKSRNSAFMVNVGDSPIFICEKNENNEIIDYIKSESHGVLNANEREFIEKYHEDISFISSIRDNPINSIAVREPNVIEAIPSFTMQYDKKETGEKLRLNVTRSLGHPAWGDVICKLPSIVEIPSNMNHVFVMSDGVSDMFIDETEFFELLKTNDWNSDKVGSILRDRWYQDWIQLFNGTKYPVDHRGKPNKIAIEGDRRQVADDMTLISIKLC